MLENNMSQTGAWNFLSAGLSWPKSTPLWTKEVERRRTVALETIEEVSTQGIVKSYIQVVHNKASRCMPINSFYERYMKQEATTSPDNNSCHTSHHERQQFTCGKFVYLYSPPTFMVGLIQVVTPQSTIQIYSTLSNMRYFQAYTCVLSIENQRYPMKSLKNNPNRHSYLWRNHLHQIIYHSKFVASPVDLLV
ncbi:hypothetical protein BDZ94DRAFT_189849 [Collybia nuda]|uniref:Uncharacterized protein n=1 Tax=Collybia nuda TaxID=64659 RepID=A0A9P5XY08_9AGAR|nr:hypothetical protein BDZ94DRAFT_189849 [Collybia nuda]